MSFSPIGAASNPASAVVTGKEVSFRWILSQRKGSKPSIGPEGVQKKRRSSVTAETIHKIAQIPKMMQSSEKKRKESIKNYSHVSYSPYKYRWGRIVFFLFVFTRNQRSHFKISIRIMVWMGIQESSESFKRWQSESIYANALDGEGADMMMNGLSICADLAKIDRVKLAQTEFTIIEFDGDTFQLLIDILHSGSCCLTCETVPGLICAASTLIYQIYFKHVFIIQRHT